MPILHVSRDFMNYGDAAFADFAAGVSAGMTGNTHFPSPTPTMADFDGVRSDFETALSEIPTSGSAKVAEKNGYRATLEGMLRELADFVETESDNDLAVLLTSGFKAASTNRASVPLEKPTGLVITNGVSTQLLGKVPPVKNRNSYEARIQPPTGPAIIVNCGTDSRHLEFNDLTPGVLYTISIRAMGGSTGHSDWSDPVAHMCM